MIFTDSHAHLSSVAEELGREALASILADYGEAARSASDEGREPPLLLDPGTEPGDLRPRLALLGASAGAPFLRLAAGIWPSAGSLASPASSLGELEAAIAASAAAGPRIAAIGEGGLDYRHIEGPREAQAELLEGQLRLAARLGLPMIVHSREAFEDSLAIVRRSPLPGTRIVIHCFGYGPAEARAFLDEGCLLSFAGNLTYKSASALREACAATPEDRLLLETDSPYMNPMPLRGRPSSPRDVERTYAAAATLRGIGLEALAEAVSRNARSLFG